MNIKDLLDGNWVNPDTGEKVKIPIQRIEIDDGISKNAAELMMSLNLGHGKIIIVSDLHTHDALGRLIEKQLKSADTIVLPDSVRPTERNASLIREKIEDYDVIVAVGSGTINDLCKYASFMCDKPYVIFGTAPSMNGYTSANASIVVEGHRKTLSAHLPEAVFLDLEILAKAPPRLIRAGLGDSICRPTAQADWLLSHLLLGTPYMEAPFKLLEESEKRLFENSAKLKKREKKTIKALAETLVLSGIGMYISGGSYPASQGEHLIAHYMETLYPQILERSFHGEQIGTTTITMAKIQEDILEMDKIKLESYEINEKIIIEHFGTIVGSNCLKEIKKKHFSKEKIEEINALLDKNWGEIRNKIKEVTISSEKLQDILISADVPSSYPELSWKKAEYVEAIKNAHLLRDRFTFLDLSKMLKN